MNHFQTMIISLIIVEKIISEFLNKSFEVSLIFCCAINEDDKTCDKQKHVALPMKKLSV